MSALIECVHCFPFMVLEPAINGFQFITFADQDLPRKTILCQKTVKSKKMHPKCKYLKHQDKLRNTNLCKES